MHDILLVREFTDSSINIICIIIMLSAADRSILAHCYRRPFRWVLRRLHRGRACPRLPQGLASIGTGVFGPIGLVSSILPPAAVPVPVVPVPHDVPLPFRGSTP
jgi:hypothetical protein